MNTKLIFEKVKDHLLSQNSRSMMNGGCVYHSDDGKKCAIGCLIKDEFYDEEFDSYGTDRFPIQIAVEKSLGVKLTKMDCRLLGDLQAIHDKTKPSEWKRELDFIEAEYLGDNNG